MVKNIIDIGHGLGLGLGLSIVAEGIEEAYSDELLRQYQCDYAQGFYYSRPMQPELICDFLTHANSAEQISHPLTHQRKASTGTS
ncbi:MAG: EAL domain-containing protein [Neptuniibacter sp.]